MYNLIGSDNSVNRNQKAITRRVMHRKQVSTKSQSETTQLPTKPRIRRKKESAKFVSAYRNEGNDIKFYEGNVQRDTPKFQDISAMIKQTPRKERFNGIFDRNGS